ncbi:MAG: prepilin-type N-terminal cleavage/methylation domain-containing protein [Candidatus Paceibacterota bacterium]
MQHPLNNIRARGFTLVELLTVISITTVVMLALTSVIRSFYINNEYLLERTQSLDSSRRGVADSIKAIREASYGDDGSYPIAAAGTSTITVYANIDSDSGVEKVKYYLSGTTLYKVVYNAAGSPPVYSSTAFSTTTLATYARNASTTPLFTYYDTNGTQLATTSPNIASIASIKVSLLVDLNPNRAPNVFILTETATLRNIKL